MVKYIKFLFHSFLLLFLVCSLFSENIIQGNGDYFIYSGEYNYIYGSGQITLKLDKYKITGQTLYMDVSALKGKIMGDIILENEDETIKCDGIVFSVFPFKYKCINFKEKIEIKGDKKLINKLRTIKIKSLKKSALYYEFKEFKLKENKRIKARFVIPYVMGIPSMPLKSFILKKGKIPDKTKFYFKNINFSKNYGLSLVSGLKIKEKFVEGNFNVKLFERGFFGIDGENRGIIVYGDSSLKIAGKNVFNYSGYLNSEYKSFDFNISHSDNLGFLFYSLSHSISGTRGDKPFHQFKANFSVDKLKFIKPQFDFIYDLKKSKSFRISSPINILSNLNLNISWDRNIIERDTSKRDDSRIFTSLDFSSSFLSLSSDLNITRDIIESNTKKDFSANIKLPGLNFLEKNLTFDLNFFYNFSSFPSGESVIEKSSPGINFSINSIGLKLPLNFILSPNFDLYQTWEPENNNKTNFSYFISFENRIKNFIFSLDYNLSSRYDAKNFWIEGYNMNNLNIRLQFIKNDYYSFASRFYFNDSFMLENISFSGKIELPFNSKVSSYMIYYPQAKKLQTLEVFLEKNFRNAIKIQGGYSLALKRVFVRVIPSL